MTTHRTACQVVSFDLSSLDELGLAEAVVLDPAGRPAHYLADHRDVMALLEAFRDDELRVSLVTSCLIYGPVITPEQAAVEEDR